MTAPSPEIAALIAAAKAAMTRADPTAINVNGKLHAAIPFGVYAALEEALLAAEAAPIQPAPGVGCHICGYHPGLEICSAAHVAPLCVVAKETLPPLGDQPFMRYRP